MVCDPVLRGDALRARFAALTQFLKDHRRVWGPRPYAGDVIDWEGDAPALSAWCRSRSDHELVVHERDPWMLRGAPAPAPRWAERARELSRVGRFEGEIPLDLRGTDLGRCIPSRKWAQVRALAATVVPRVQAGQTLVDWCAGKGHLGRTLAHLTGADAVLVERRRELCDAGAKRARDEGVLLRCVAADASGDAARAELCAGRFAVALHACGALGEEFVESAIAGEVDSLALSPCCHHRIGGPSYRPASSTAAAAGLPLTRGDLKLTTTEQRHASPAIAQARVRSMVWQLGFDLAAREAAGTDPRTRTRYLHPRHLKVSFRAFCEQSARRHDLPLATPWDDEATLAMANTKVRQMRGLNLVRWIFRRPLELWLILDRALRLEEAGYNVEVGTFCARSVTARNLLLLARRSRSRP